MMRTLFVRIARVAALAALVSAWPALADAPCVEDAARLCPGIPAGDTRLWACLTQKQFQLSAECQANVREVQRRASEFSIDCANDIYRFCPRVAPGGGRVVECLAVYVGRRELGSNCEEAVVTALEKLQEFADACSNDAAALCPNVQPGGGKVFLCLRSQSDKVSSRCRRALNPK